MKKVLFLLFFTAAHFVQAQNDVHLKFSPVFKNAPLNTDSLYITSKGDSIGISSFRMYISSIVLDYKIDTIIREINSYHLLDINDPESFDIAIAGALKGPIRIIFNVGIDSITSVSGALGGDLDPGKGMYWAWQSGYVNFKVEGKSSSCKTHKNEFGFHVGGYMQPFYALKTISLPVSDMQQNTIEIKIDLAQFFEKIDLSKSNSIMIPGKEAMQIADNCSTIFSVK